MLNGIIVLTQIFKEIYDGLFISPIWGISAVGSASHWQCGGQGFKSPMLHQQKP